MAAFIALLRGVNLGGHKMIKMEELRALCVSLKLRRPQTYLQSGNVVFETPEQDPLKLAARLESAIEKKMGFHSDVLIRSVADLRGVVSSNPFAGRDGIEPAKLLVTFLSGEPGADTEAKIASLKVDQEELRLLGRELYIYFPNGQGKSKLSFAPFDRGAGKFKWTGRNWNTVSALLAMAESFSAA
jgi:uncharacterized protein (DUF1697 family)